MAIALPSSGKVTIGRGADNDVVVDAASMSRHHAILHLGPSLRIEDAGSSNGTVLRGVRRGGVETGRMIETRLSAGQSAAIGQGDVVGLGSLALVITHADPTAKTAARSSGGDPTRGIIVADESMRRLYELAIRVAAGDIPILVAGETGAGKEVVAEVIHRASPRAKGPLLQLNCAALPQLLLESELYGYEKGAFTGATQAKPGLLEMAQGGTVFLDEIGEMPLTTQAKLLRVLEERKVLPVGALRPRPIDVRFVAATNRDLEEEVKRQTFRQDLYFRINGVSLLVPPLRERVGEIEPLARHFVAEACTRQKRPTPLIAADVVAFLRKQAWPGNARELKNVMERALLFCGSGPIQIDHLQLEGAAPPADPPPPSLKGEIEALERQRIIDALAQCAGNQSQAARLLNMPRRTFVKRLASYGIPRPRGPGDAPKSRRS